MWNRTKSSNVSEYEQIFTITNINLKTKYEVHYNAQGILKQYCKAQTRFFGNRYTAMRSGWYPLPIQRTTPLCRTRLQHIIIMMFITMYVGTKKVTALENENRIETRIKKIIVNLILNVLSKIIRSKRVLFFRINTS